jgi:SAM-dependent methyltransferase
MSTGYRLAYLLHITPWEAAGKGFARFLDASASDAVTPPHPGARALDIGCGSGSHSVTLARRGWSVTAIDAVPRALRRAARLVATSGADVTLVEGDVTAMRSKVGNGFELLLDVGCFHGLNDAQRADYVREVDAVSAPGATLLMLAFTNGAHGPLPRGVDADEIVRSFDQWSLVRSERADTSTIPGPLKKLEPHWHWLTKAPESHA